jgi:hypothetical protein
VVASSFTDREVGDLIRKHKTAEGYQHSEEDCFMILFETKYRLAACAALGIEIRREVGARQEEGSVKLGGGSYEQALNHGARNREQLRSTERQRQKQELVQEQATLPVPPAALVSVAADTAGAEAVGGEIDGLFDSIAAHVVAKRQEQDAAGESDLAMPSVGTSDVSQYKVGQYFQCGAISGYIVQIIADTPGAEDGRGKIFIGNQGPSVHCPECGEPAASSDARFCSECGEGLQ